MLYRIQEGNIGNSLHVHTELLSSLGITTHKHTYCLHPSAADSIAAISTPQQSDWNEVLLPVIL